MALLLGAYCISSIRAARRDAKHGLGMPVYQNHKRIHSTSSSSPDSETTSKATRAEPEAQPSSWIVQQLEKKREEEKARENARRILRGEMVAGKEGERKR